METNNENFETHADAKQFRIEVADGHMGRFYTVKPLGNTRYELIDDDGSIGSIQLDERNHAHCESVGCELDLPLMNAIRSQIQFHEEWKGID